MNIADARRADAHARRATNFSVVRVKRDILRRSSVGAIAHGAIGGAEPDRRSNQAYGVDGTFAFFDNLAFNTYWARHATTGLAGDDTSYPRADRLRRRSLRRAARAARSSATTSTRRSGSCAATTCARSFGQVRFSPRPAVDRVGPQVLGDRHDRPTSRTAAAGSKRATADGEFAIELQNSDRFSVGATDSYELLTQPFAIAPTVQHPGRRLRLHRRRGWPTRSDSSGRSPARRVERGTFYDGHRTSADVQPHAAST